MFNGCQNVSRKSNLFGIVIFITSVSHVLRKVYLCEYVCRSFLFKRGECTQTIPNNNNKNQYNRNFNIPVTKNCYIS